MSSVACKCVESTHYQRAVFLRAAFKLLPIRLVPRVFTAAAVSGGRHLLGEEHAPVTARASFPNNYGLLGAMRVQ